jgi:hypothetical protein
MKQYTNLLDLIPTRRPNEFQVRLNTPFKPCFIGRLYTNGAGKFLTRKLEQKHLHRNSHSIAINAALLYNPEFKFQSIEIDFVHEDGRIEKLRTSREYFLANGKPFCYKGYEPQIALELSLFGQEKVYRFEREHYSQTELFKVDAA